MIKITVEELKKKNSGKVPFSSYGGYPIVYFVENFGSPEVFCGDCIENALAETHGSRKLIGIISGSDYENDMLCEKCGEQLSAYFFIEES